MERSVGAPHPARFADDHRHGGVDDDIIGNVEVGDAPVRIDHGQGRPLGVDGLEVGLDFRSLRLREDLDFRVHVAQAVVDVHPQLLEHGGVLVQGFLIKNRDGVAEHDRIGHLHHRRLQMERQEETLGLGLLDFFGVEFSKRFPAHEGRRKNFIREGGQILLQDLDRPVLAREFDPDRPFLLVDRGFFVAVEISGGHVDHAGFGIRLPGTQLVGMRLGEVFDRKRRPPVGVALAEDGIHGASQDFGITGLDHSFRFVLRAFGIVREGVALGLELPDGALELGNRGADVRQLDDVGLGPGRQLAQLGQVILDPLIVPQVIGEIGDDASGERDVARFDFNARSLGESLNDRKQGIGGQSRRFVRLRPDDRLLRHDPSFSALCSVPPMRNRDDTAKRNVR
ncbi:MAG: hypothetical protein BWX98_02334 [Candidatus Aminicenantes bacterium ADurb.Bin147]|nr:MAG: hypothetical protein BWX98_02334 [Candidatus Aminicenantes bacterium ADurb.Bin147]